MSCFLNHRADAGKSSLILPKRCAGLIAEGKRRKLQAQLTRTPYADKQNHTRTQGIFMRLAIQGFFYALLFSVAVQAQDKSLKEIAREISQAVVVIEALDERGSVIGQGSGFIVTPSGAIVSNLHVVQGAASARIKLPNGDVYKTADIVEVDEVKDIIILKIKGFKLPTVRLGDSDKAETGDAIAAISSPEGLTNSLSTGVISGVRRLDTHRVFQLTAPISQGSSGGAVFNLNGEVIGIITYLLKSGQNINFAVPINYARGMVSDQTTKTFAQLQPPPKQKDAAPATPSVLGGSEDELDAQLTGATRGKLGRSPQAPMFVRPDEALILFYRLVENIGLYTATDVADLTRTAAAVKTKDEDNFEQYTIKYFSFHNGLALSFGKPDRLLTDVELLVSWSVEDLKNTYGDKFKRRKQGSQQILDYGKLPNGRQLIAFLDGNGNVRSVRFSKAK